MAMPGRCNKMAHKIIEDQKREIAELTGWLEEQEAQ